MTNYYDDVKDKCKVVHNNNDYEIFSKANEEPQNWIVLVDGDVDIVTLYDKMDNIAYEINLKGYELLEANIVGQVAVEYVYIEDFLDRIR